MNSVCRHGVRQLNGISSTDQETNLRIMMCRCVVGLWLVLVIAIGRRSQCCPPSVENIAECRTSNGEGMSDVEILGRRGTAVRAIRFGGQRTARPTCAS